MTRNIEIVNYVLYSPDMRELIKNVFVFLKIAFFLVVSVDLVVLTCFISQNLFFISVVQ